MSVVEKKADDLGQIIFRLEIHINLIRNHAQTDTIGSECLVKIESELERLKQLKSELSELKTPQCPTQKMRLVILESPYAGDIVTNVNYARACVRDSLSRGEAPIASHLLYTQPGILRDEVDSERQWGIDAGLAWRGCSEATVVYTDRGISKGMQYGIAAAVDAGKPVEYRELGGSWRV